MARHVFLSFVEEDLKLVNLFRGQAKIENNDLEFDDFSVKVPYDSENADYIKQQIRDKISNVSVTLCLIGRSTHNSDWVNWEISASSVKEKGLVGMRLNSDSNDIIPSTLRNEDAKIVDWKINEVVSAIEDAAKKAGY